MTKTPTVAEAMRALATTLTEPAPVRVKVVEDKLNAAELGQLLITLIVTLPIRALAVWGVLAIFFPTLGLTYIAVLAILWAIPHVMPPRVADMAKSIIAKRK